MKKLILSVLVGTCSGLCCAKDITDEQKQRLHQYVQKMVPNGQVTHVSAVAPDKSLPDGIDFVALYTHEDPEGNGGNDYEQRLAVFSNPINRAVLDERVGGKAYRSVSLSKVASKLVRFDVKFYDQDDALCCPSVPGSTAYTYHPHALSEISTKVFLENK